MGHPGCQHWKPEILRMIYNRLLEYGQHKQIKLRYIMYSCAPVSTGNMFQDLPWLREIADNTKCYI
jgi:hypothetical protein